MYYLILLDGEFSNKSSKHLGYILGRNAESYKLDAKKLSHGIVESDGDYKIGEVIPALVDKYWADAKKRKLLELTVEATLLRNMGKDIPDALLFELADQEYSLADALLEFGNEANDIIRQRENERIAEALKHARRRDILNESAQLNLSAASTHIAIASSQAFLPIYQLFLPAAFIIERFTLPPLDKAAQERSKLLTERVVAESHFFICPAITASVSGCVAFDGDVSGSLVVAADAKFFVHFGSLEMLDAICKAVSIKAILKEEVIPVCLVLDKDTTIERINKLYSTPEKQIKSPVRSNELDGWLKLLRTLLPYPALLNKENKIFNTQGFALFVSLLTGIDSGNAELVLSDRTTKSQTTSFVLDVFKQLENAVPQLKEFLNEKVSICNQTNLIFNYPVFWEALAAVAKRFLTETFEYESSQIERLNALRVIDVNMDSPQWISSALLFDLSSERSRVFNIISTQLCDLLGLPL